MSRSDRTLAILETIDFSSSSRYQRFADLGESMGVKILRPQGIKTLEGIKQSWNETEEFLRTADSFLISGLGIELVPHLQQRFYERINSGARAYIVASVHSAQSATDMKSFLGRYYLAPTTLKIVAPDGGRIAVSFSRRAGSLIAPEFFSGVETLTVSSPYAIRYGTESWALLQGLDDHWPVDMLTDYEPAEWNARDLVRLAIWRGSATGARGAVVLDTSSGLIADPVDVLAGRAYGIERNEVFARNLIGFLTEAEPVDRPPSARDLFERIEINTCDYCVGVLKANHKDWWARVPFQIRTAAESRGDAHQYWLQPHALLLFSEYARIIETNAALFNASLIEQKSDVSAIKARFRALNNLRPLLFAHPTRAYVSGYETSSDEYRLLREVDALMIELARPYSGHAKPV